MFSCRLGFSQGPYSQEWIIHEPRERFYPVLHEDTPVIGVSSPHGIVPLSRDRVDVDGDDDDLFIESCYIPFPRESEYFSTWDSSPCFFDDFFSFHSLKELRVHNDKWEMSIRPKAQLSPNAPLFHTLTVLDVPSALSSFFAGHTFHKLEKYREGYNLCKDDPVPVLLTEMPVCTRLAVPLSRLATLKLPRICELGVYSDIGLGELDCIWGQHVAVNANLSGLKLLHLYTEVELAYHTLDVVKILGSLPALETLVIDGIYLDDRYVDFFKAFVPMNAQGTSGLNQSSCEGQVSRVLCPRLESLQIEYIELPDEKTELIAVLKDIVSLRAMKGFPLKSFTILDWSLEEKWELIGRERSFTMEVVPFQHFLLDI